MEDLLETLHYLLKPGLALSALLMLSFFVMMLLRGRRVHRCLSCGAQKVRRTRPNGLFDAAASFLLIRPHRCEGCRERFYAMRVPPWLARPQRKRVLSIVFQVRDGSFHGVAIRLIYVRPLPDRDLLVSRQVLLEA